MLEYSNQELRSGIHLNDTRPQQNKSQLAKMTDAKHQIELAELLARIRQQDETAFAEFYDLTVHRIYGLVFKILLNADDSEEVVSDVYAQIWQQAERYHPDKGTVVGWILMLARCRALDLYRKRKTFQQMKDDVQTFMDESSLEGSDSHLLIQVDESHSALHRSLNSLSEAQRQLLSLSFFKGLSHSEIARTTGMPEGTVKSHIRRAIIALQDAIKE